MQFTDALQIGQPRRTKEGYLAVRARAARTGVYRYSGREIDAGNAHGLRDLDTVNVLRDENTVFDRAAAQSFIGKPITVDHPHESVTAANWKDHARGAIMGALRDGEHLAFDLLLMDDTAIAAVDAGKRELSNGYAAELEFGDFTAPDGTRCQARQTRITDGNHIAIVTAGRAGPECRISDGGNALFQNCDAVTVIAPQFADEETNKMPHTLIIDGLQVPDVSDAAKAAIEKLQGQVTDAKAAATTAETALADARKEHDKALGTRDAEIETLKGQIVDQTKIDALADAKADVVSKAKAVLGDKAPDAKGKSIADVRRAAVAAKFGDAAVADKSDDYIEARFDAMTADAKAQDQQHQPILMPVITGDAVTARDAALKDAEQRERDAWKPKAAA